MTIWCNVCGKELEDRAFHASHGMINITRADEEHQWDELGTFCSDDCMFEWFEKIRSNKVIEK